MREPAVVTAIERQLHLGARRHRPQEQGRIEYLDIDLQCVNMRQAGGDIGEVAGIFRDVQAEIGIGDDPVVDAPEVDAIFLRDQDFRREAAIFFQHEIPGLFCLDDMGIGVDDCHGDLPPRSLSLR